MQNNENERIFEQKDSVYLQEQLEKIHYDIYRNVDKETLTESLEKASQVDPQYFKIALQESLALIGDAHTRVSGILNDNFLPLEVREIDGSYFIIGSSEKYKSLLCKRIVEINGFSVMDIEKKVSNLSSKENNEVLKKDNAVYMTSNKVLEYYGFSSSKQVKITTDEATEEVSLNTGAGVKHLHPLRWKDCEINNPTFFGNDIYRFRIEGKTLLFQYNSCTNNGRSEEELNYFKKKLLSTVSSVNTIVVDLRENRGGDTGIMENLFAEFPNDKAIYVAIGRDTFSSAMHHLLYLKREKGAVLVGENAGQKPNRFGDNKSIVLPNTNIKISCSYKYFELLPGNNIDVIKPDIEIPVTIEDYRSNKDPLNQWIKDNL